METFKLIIASLLSPLLISLTLQSLGWLFYLRRRQRAGLSCIFCGTVILVIGGLGGLTFEKRRSQEFVHPPLNAPSNLNADRPILAVVLGSGFNSDPELPGNSQVSGTFLARLLEGVRIYRSHPQTRLLISIAGKAAPEKKRHFADQMITLLQLDPTRITVSTESKSTSDEAEEAVRQHKGEQVIVVTSASHMVRAMTIFSDAGLTPIAAPTDYGFTRSGSPDEKIWPRWIPTTDGIGGNHQWLYETAASIWHRVSGE
ncbi:MAG: YdcF family protein [Planctomycetota bacterium]|nr:YdcF family protein [Planctomycetota bacterium]